MAYGLYEVLPGKIYQVRGFDLSNITFVEGNEGFIVVDPLTSAEPAVTAPPAIDREPRSPPAARRGEVIQAGQHTVSELKARIAANQWDGTRQGAVDAWSVMFDGTGVTFQIQDNADMSMDVLVYTDHPLDAVTTALITGGYLGIKPSGVTINSYTITEV